MPEEYTLNGDYNEYLTFLRGHQSVIFAARVPADENQDCRFYLTHACFLLPIFFLERPLLRL